MECSFLKLILEFLVAMVIAAVGIFFGLPSNDSNQSYLNGKKFFFLSLWVFSLNIQESQDCRGRGRLILTPLHHLVSLHKHLHILGAITAKSSPQHIVKGLESGTLSFRTQVPNH